MLPIENVSFQLVGKANILDGGAYHAKSLVKTIVRRRLLSNREEMSKRSRRFYTFIYIYKFQQASQLFIHENVANSCPCIHSPIAISFSVLAMFLVEFFYR